MKSPESLNTNLIFLAGKVTKKIHELLTDEFKHAGFDITVEQFGVLSLLWYQDGINQQTIADSLDRDKTTIVRIIDNMIKKNLIVKVDDREDLRNKRIHLTHKGRELQDKSIQVAGSVYFKAMDGIDQSDIDKSLLVLSKLLKNLE